jgi:hypothetical protein
MTSKFLVGVGYSTVDQMGYGMWIQHHSSIFLLLHTILFQLQMRIRWVKTLWVISVKLSYRLTRIAVGLPFEPGQSVSQPRDLSVVFCRRKLHWGVYCESIWCHQMSFTIFNTTGTALHHESHFLNSESSCETQEICHWWWCNRFLCRLWAGVNGKQASLWCPLCPNWHSG